MANEFFIEKIEDFQKWDEFVERSPEGTIFSKYNYLKNIQREFDLFYIISGTEPRAGVALIKNRNKDGYELDNLVIYNGFLFEKPKPNQKKNGIISEQFKLVEFFLREMGTRGIKNLSMSLSPEIKDVRAFLWHNYNGNTDLQKYHIDIRYTTYLNIAELKNNTNIEGSDLFNGLDMKRRQSIRKAAKMDVVVKESLEVEILLEFYKKTFEKQKKLVDDLKLDQMKNLINSTFENKTGKLFVCYGKSDPVSVAHFINDTKRSYYLFGASDTFRQDDYSGTMVLWEAFKKMANEGVEIVDLEGVNSPTRGWFKLSFGGSLEAYYEVSLG